MAAPTTTTSNSNPASATSAASATTKAPPAAAQASEVVNELYSRSAQFLGQLDMQRTWGLAHLTFLLLTFVYVFNASCLGVRVLGVCYKLGMLCLICSYGIAVKRHVGHLLCDMQTLERAFSYDGAPYFCLALMWWVMTTPVPITLLPLSIYSMYHAIAWAKDDAVVKRSKEWRQWGESLCLKLTAQQSSLLFAAAHLEIAALPYMLLAWLMSKRGPGFAQLLFYFQFLRWQYSVSPKIRSALMQWKAAWDAAIQHPSCPKGIRSGDHWMRQQVKAFANLSQPQPMPRSSSSSSSNHHRAFPGAGANNKKIN